MSDQSGFVLPTHVVRYLRNQKVDPDQLPDNVRETLSELSLGEVALLALVGAELREADLDVEIIARIH